MCLCVYIFVCMCVHMCLYVYESGGQSSGLGLVVVGMKTVP